MRAAERAEVYAMNFFLGDEINHGERVAGSFGAVVGDEGEFAVGGSGDFVRAFACVNARDYLVGGGVYDGEWFADLFRTRRAGEGVGRLRGACGGE